ncbi:hypothetical protein AX14_012210 [Amanita brunnescens Koide BX004]|nr:hypothetical protein AX14_012210 [Amanita brunnescens Koide BX004]
MIQLLDLMVGQWAVRPFTRDLIHVIRRVIVEGVLSPLLQLPNEFRIIYIFPIDAKSLHIINVVLSSLDAQISMPILQADQEQITWSPIFLSPKTHNMSIPMFRPFLNVVVEVIKEEMVDQPKVSS